MLRWYVVFSIGPVKKRAESQLNSMTAPVEAHLIVHCGNTFPLIVFHVVPSVVRLSE